MIKCIRPKTQGEILQQTGKNGKVKEVVDIHVVRVASPQHKTFIAATIYTGYDEQRSHTTITLTAERGRELAETILSQLNPHEGVK